MIRSAPYYWVTCDKCGEKAEYYEHSAWSEEWTAVEYAEADDWITSGDKHFCLDCQVVCTECNIRCATPDANSKGKLCDGCQSIVERES